MSNVGPDPGNATSPGAGVCAPERRRWIGAAAGAALLAGCRSKPGSAPAKAESAASAVPASGSPAPGAAGMAETSSNYVPKQRLALLVSNGSYPNGQDLPPARKNLKDMTAALEALGFEVSPHLDLSASAMQRALSAFTRRIDQARPNWGAGDAAVVFYFCGHGLEVDGINLLVPAGVDPTRSNVLDASVRLTEITNLLPKGYPGVTLSFIDACRISLSQGTDSGQLNQVKAPDGTIVMFGTRKGRPALAPNTEARNTFFTQAIVESLNQPESADSVYDFCRIVEDRCVQNVSAEFARLKLKFESQYPQTASNIRGTFRLSSGATRAEREAAEAEAKWNAIDGASRPHDVVAACEAFLRDHPKSARVPVVRSRLTGASDMLRAVRNAEFSRDALVPEVSGRADYQEDFVRALRGDKDAAMRVADRYETGDSGLPRNRRRYEQWLRVATELGNGIASWALYQYYTETGSQDRAAHFRTRAIDELGYRPPKEVIFK